MKGLICEEIDRFRLTDDLPEPERAEGEAIVRIRRIGICGTDYHAFKGNQPFFSYPRILGHELAGVVEAVGEGESVLRAGDPVAIIPYMHCGQCVACRNGRTNCCTSMKVLGVHIDGGMREKISVPVSHLIPAHGLEPDQIALVEPLAIGAHAVRRAEPKQGENVLVIGAGPIGLGVMAFAKYRGARVIAMDVNEERLQFCRSWADVDAVANALDNPAAVLAELTGGEYPTVVFDATGNARSMSDSFQYVAHGGKLVYVGLVKADISFNDPEFHKREMTLMGSRNATREDFHCVMDALRSGSIDGGRYITHRATFDEMIGEFERVWLKPESKVIKAMVEL